eukprot:6961670-Heterocapsa_arctica.AAC.1
MPPRTSSWTFSGLPLPARLRRRASCGFPARQISPKTSLGFALLPRCRPASASCPSFQARPAAARAVLRRRGILCSRLCRSHLARPCASAVVHRHLRRPILLHRRHRWGNAAPAPM